MATIRWPHNNNENNGVQCTYDCILYVLIDVFVPVSDTSSDPRQTSVVLSLVTTRITA